MGEVKQKPEHSEKALFRKLRDRYKTTSYILIPQVKSAVRGPCRIADAVAIGTWGSIDPHVHGFEMKSSRASWKSELMQPEKAEGVGRYCQYWWIVASKEGIVEPAELPSSWGLYVLQRGALELVVEAKKRDVAPLDSSFVASILSSAVDQDVLMDSEEIEKKGYEEGYARGIAEGKERAARDAQSSIDGLVGRLHDQKQALNEIEDLLGLPLDKLDHRSLKSLRKVLEAYKIISDYRGVDEERLQELLDAYSFFVDNPIEKVAQKMAAISQAVRCVLATINHEMLKLPKEGDESYKMIQALQREAKAILGAAKKVEDPWLDFKIDDANSGA
jgi:hypothetical protein